MILYCSLHLPLEVMASYRASYTCNANKLRKEYNYIIIIIIIIIRKSRKVSKGSTRGRQPPIDGEQSDDGQRNAVV